MKVLLIGADGQLGTDLCKIIDKKELIPLTISDIDITNLNQTLEVIKKYSPDIVINTAAYHRVDECEEADLLAFQVNAVGVKNVCLGCKEAGAAIVQISTDYVFDGEKKTPYTEEDIPNPRTAYGISKLAGEYYVKYLLNKYFIIRTSGLFGVAGCLGKGGTNFVENMIKKAKEDERIAVVTDEILSPTYTLDLARKINQLIKTEHYGLYHITNNGQCSWYEFALKIFELLKMKVEVKATTSAQYKTKANRPKYSVLRNYNLEKLGMDDLRTWDAALKEYLKEKRYLK